MKRLITIVIVGLITNLTASPIDSLIQKAVALPENAKGLKIESMKEGESYFINVFLQGDLIDKVVIHQATQRTKDFKMLRAKSGFELETPPHLEVCKYFLERNHNTSGKWSFFSGIGGKGTNMRYLFSYHLFIPVTTSPEDLVTVLGAMTSESRIQENEAIQINKRSYVIDNAKPNNEIELLKEKREKLISEMGMGINHPLVKKIDLEIEKFLKKE